MPTDISILIVDDQPENLLILEDQLIDHYAVLTASNGQAALDLLQQNEGINLILMDVMMPEIDGFQACQQIKSDPKLKDIPLLFITSLDNASDEAYALSLGAEDFIHKPFSAPVVLARVRTHLQLAEARKALQQRNENLEQIVLERTRRIVKQNEELNRRTKQLVAAQGATISALCSLAEARDSETGNHILRTQSYVRVLAEHLRNHHRFSHELSDSNIEEMVKSAPLHDIGKVAIPDHVLLKPGRLTDEEWSIMRRHCEFGRNAILDAERELGEGLQDSFLRYAREISYHHHERWDGKGYPCSLRGDEIPIAARLMAIADVYDALISKRIYKPAFSHERAVEIIRQGLGSHFDPDVAQAMLDLERAFQEIAERHKDG